LAVSSPQTQNLTYAIDMRALRYLEKFGITRDRYQPKNDQPVTADNPILHPYRILSLSNPQLTKINVIQSKRGPAGDSANGYAIVLTRMESAGGKVDYMPQGLPDKFPLNIQEVLEDLRRLGMPDFRQWHFADNLANITKSLFFQGHVKYDKAVEMLERYAAMGKIVDLQKASAIKAMQTYATNHGLALEASAPISSNLQAPPAVDAANPFQPTTASFGGAELPPAGMPPIGMPVTSLPPMGAIPVPSTTSISPIGAPPVIATPAPIEVPPAPPVATPMPIPTAAPMPAPAALPFTPEAPAPMPAPMVPSAPAAPLNLAPPPVATPAAPAPMPPLAPPPMPPMNPLAPPMPGGMPILS
jgi:hypothetical protein